MDQSGERPWMVISSERVTAQVRVPAGQQVNLSTLRDLLSSLGVVYGIDAQALCGLSVRASEERSVLVAKGHLPSVIVDRQVHLGSSMTPPATVSAGDTIGWLIGEGSIHGRAVDGQSLWPMFPLTCGHAITVEEDGAVRCSCAGTLKRHADGTIFIDIGSETYEMVSVTINFTDDKTSAYVIIPAWHYLPPHILQKAMVEAKIVRGVMSEAIVEAYVAQATERKIEIARGIPINHGVDGHVAMLIDEHIHLRVAENGQVDYREHGRLEDVSGGTALGRIVPPTLGVHGVDVFGAFLAPRPGRALDAAQIIGEGTELDPAHPDIIRALATGHVHRDRTGRLCVQGRYVVDEHVDYHHGNINTKLSVAIKGDIRAGFIVKSEGDIEIMGVIEDARVTAQGHLVIRAGILPGTQRVKAHGDIDVKHVASRSLKCHNLRVTISLRWSQVMAVGEVIAKEILGGSITAGGNITCDVLGSKDGLHTRVQAGFDPYEAELFSCAHREHDTLLAAVCEQKAQCKMKGQQVLAKQLSEQEWQVALAEFSAACKRLATCEALLDRAEILRKRRANTPCTAVVMVNGMAYRGTEIWLSDHAHVVLDKDLARPRFYDKDGTVAW